MQDLETAFFDDRYFPLLRVELGRGDAGAVQTLVEQFFGRILPRLPQRNILCNNYLLVDVE